MRICESNQWWSKEMTKYLIDNKNRNRIEIAEEMTELFGRAISAQLVRNRLSRMGLSRKPEGEDQRDIAEMVLKWCYIKTDRQIAYYTGVNDSTVRRIRETMFDKEKNRPVRYTTLCWYCAMSVGKCEWSCVGRRDGLQFMPVEGWVAVPRHIPGMESVGTLSYSVRECPKYERG